MSSHLTAQQKAVLEALAEQSPLPTTILYDVRVPWPGDPRNPDRTYAIQDPVGAVLRRMEKRGLVTGERDRKCVDWWITDAGLEAIGKAPVA